MRSEVYWSVYEVYRLVHKIRLDPNNWLLPVAYYGSAQKKNESPPFSRIPKHLCVGGIDFKLAFLTYSQDVPGHQFLKHEVSMQLIRGQWYLYDGFNPLFTKWTAPTYELSKARLSMIIYMKQVKPQI